MAKQPETFATKLFEYLLPKRSPVGPVGFSYSTGKSPPCLTLDGTRQFIARSGRTWPSDSFQMPFASRQALEMRCYEMLPMICSLLAQEVLATGPGCRTRDSLRHMDSPDGADQRARAGRWWWTWDMGHGALVPSHTTPPSTVVRRRALFPSSPTRRVRQDS